MDPVVEVREDEEQGVKLQETMELLVAAGYFRARIKGLDPFDKVVGGMVWCLEVCNLDIDVDLSFQESLTIGQKISLTEKIVAVLPELNCPHRLDPHQIQGLDFVHIYPVVQWLVKKAIETREESGDSNRAYALRQFEKKYTFPEDKQKQKNLTCAEQTIVKLNDVYAPRRKFRRKPGVPVADVPTQIRFTLLEYGHRPDGSVPGDGTTVEPTKKGGKKGTENQKSAAEVEQEHYKVLVGNMEEMDDRGRRVKASVIGNIVGQQADQIAQMEALHDQQKAQLEEIMDSGMVFGPNKDKHMLEMVGRQLEELKSREIELIHRRSSLQDKVEDLKNQKRELKETKIKLDEDNAKLDQLTGNMDEAQLDLLSGLLAEKLALEQNIADFRTKCKIEATQLNDDYKRLMAEIENPLEERAQLKQSLEERLEVERNAVKQVRLKLALRNREIAQFQRRLDDIPPQAELSQYQKRFIELYDQVAAKLRETKKYYTLYNTLTDSRMYYEKEVGLLESIYDNFDKAIGSDSGKEQFLQQLEQILDGLRQTMTKAEKRRVSEKLKRDQLSDKYQELLEKQRVYHKLVKEFQEECAKNETLQASLEAYPS